MRECSAQEPIVNKGAIPPRDERAPFGQFQLDQPHQLVVDTYIEPLSGPGSPLQFRLLEPARQLTIDGREEPLFDVVGQHAQADAPEPEDAYQAQASLFGYPQAELPLHQTDDGKIHPDCLRGWVAKTDEHARDGASEARVVPQCCGRQRCQCSKDGNDAERSRDRWNGTKRRKTTGERIGLRHVIGDAALGVLVVTLPPHLRPSATKAKAQLSEWGRQAYAALREVLRAKVGYADAEFWVRCDWHPCGENAQQWKPHLNFMVAGWAWLPSKGAAKRFSPHLELSALREAMSEVQARVFGDGENSNCHWQYHQTEGEKRHQAAYVPRTFPEWAHLRLRPVPYGLAHPKNRRLVVEALESLKGQALSVWAHTELREGLEPAPITGRGSTQEEARANLERAREWHRSMCSHCSSRAASSYPEYRRTMGVRLGAFGPAPPGLGASPEDLARWRVFQTPSA